VTRLVGGLSIALALIAGPAAAQSATGTQNQQNAQHQQGQVNQQAQQNQQSQTTRSQETVIVTATVAPAPIGNVGRAVDIVTREDIDNTPAGSVADLLRTLSSVDVRARGPFGVQTDFSLRGAGFGQTLVLVDGVRLNDAQSGHHNGDIPVTLADIERIEVLRGGGSSLHGADAFGGTINIITRRARTGWNGDFDAGQHGLVEAAIGAGFRQDGGGGDGGSDGDAAITHHIGASASRSDGFMPDRDHDVYTFDYRADVGRDTTIFASHTNKEFGANGFYGPAPSREWTKQTLVRGERRWLARDRWLGTVQASYRTHGDRFVYNQTNPALSDNRHRSHATTVEAKMHYTLSDATQISVGAGGGGDWIRSTNLGDRNFGRGSVYAEVQQRLGSRVTISPGLRFDAYNRFGSSWSPAIAASGWLSSHLKWRSSGGHAFRVPTFTELYYTDPNNLGSPDLKAETAWTADAGLDLFGARGWSGSVTGFGRWESNVIDWVRASAADRWRTTNVRDVTTRGVETEVRRRIGASMDAGLQYTWQELDAPSLGLLSKYVLAYAPHTIALSGSGRFGNWTAGPSLQFKRRIDGQEYWLADLRISRRLARSWDIYADGTNLFNTGYYEVSGVPMPGRWLRIGIRRR
jgi:iron complex outermembrane receptor protein